MNLDCSGFASESLYIWLQKLPYSQPIRTETNHHIGTTAYPGQLYLEFYFVLYSLIYLSTLFLFSGSNNQLLINDIV